MAACSGEACPFCAGRLRETYTGIRDRLETTTETFAVYECVACGAGVLKPAPVGDVSAFYPTNYLSAEADAGAVGGRFDLEKWYRYNQYAYDFRLLTRASGVRIGESPSYLDLGCGSGERVTYATRAGCARAAGVDKFEFAKRGARQQANLLNSDILDFTPSEKFRVVSLFHVLEHLHNPGEVLAHIKATLLETGGHVIIQVPNYGALERRLFGRRWFGLDVPRHYWHFNERAIRRLMGDESFRVEAVYRRNAPLHPVTIVPSMFPQLDVQRIWVKPAKGRGYKQSMKLLWAGVTVLSVPLGMIESLVDQASMLTVVASG